LRGPSPGPIEKSKDGCRWQRWIFTGSVTKISGELDKLRSEFPWPEEITQVLDVDPVGLT